MAYAVTKCFKCKKMISGKSREIGKQPFHFECLTCINCKAVLAADDHGKIRDNRIFCKTCYTKRFRPRCDACKQPIAEGDGLKTQGKVLHTMCFRCAGCQRPMGPGKQVAIQGEIYCQLQCQRERVNREKAAAEALAKAAQAAKQSTAPPPPTTPAPAPAAPEAPKEAEAAPQPVETAAVPEAPAAEGEAPPADAPPPAEGGGEAPPAEGAAEAPPAQ